MQNCIGLQHNMQFLSSRPHYDNRDTFLHAAYCRLEGVTRERVDIELEVGLRMQAETDLGGARWSPPTESLRDKQKPWVINSVTVDESQQRRAVLKQTEMIRDTCPTTGPPATPDRPDPVRLSRPQVTSPVNAFFLLFLKHKTYRIFSN